MSGTGGSRFDDVARIVSAPIPRRHAFRLVAAVLGGAALGPLWPRRVSAGVPSVPGVDTSVASTPMIDRALFCPKRCTPVPIIKNRNCCANATDTCCNASSSCCDSDHPVCCSSNCCKATHTCCGGACCPPLFGCCPPPIPLPGGGFFVIGHCCGAGETCCGLGCCPAGYPLCCDPECCDPTVEGCVAGYGCCDLDRVCTSRFNGKVSCCPVKTLCFLGQCVPFEEFAYDGGGLGKLVDANVGVTVARLHLGGVTDTGTANSFAATADIQGGLSAFNYGTRTLVQTSALTEATGAVAMNGDVTISGSGPAMINGIAAPVVFHASKTAGVVTFEVFEASTMTPLAGGTGEAGRSSLDLAVAQNA